MADRRPGGLTALAVFNFIFGGLGLLGSLAFFALIAAADAITSDALGAATSEAGASVGVLYLLLILGLVSAGLMIASGVGYLGQKAFLGRKLGNIYAALSLLSTVIGLIAMSQGFGIGTIIGLVYPVLTLVLINNNFKDDLVN